LYVDVLTPTKKHNNKNTKKIVKN